MAHSQGAWNHAIRHEHPTIPAQQQWSLEAAGRSIISFQNLLAILGLLLVISGCRPAQIGPSDEVLGAVDALYTAIASRRVELLDKSAARLEELHTSGELPEAAHRQLKSYIEKSRAGKWDAAVRELHEFIRGQRRVKS